MTYADVSNGLSSPGRAFTRPVIAPGEPARKIDAVQRPTLRRILGRDLAIAALSLAALGVAPALAEDDLPPYAGSHDDASYGGVTHATYTLELPRGDGALSLATRYDDTSYGAGEEARPEQRQALSSREHAKPTVRLAKFVISPSANSQSTPFETSSDHVTAINGVPGSSLDVREGAPVRAAFDEAMAHAARAQDDDLPPYAGAHDDAAYGDASHAPF